MKRVKTAIGFTAALAAVAAVAVVGGVSGTTDKKAERSPAQMACDKNLAKGISCLGTPDNDVLTTVLAKNKTRGGEISGLAGDDKLTGGAKRDIFFGDDRTPSTTVDNVVVPPAGGNDTLSGLGGKDELYGGSGNDSLKGGLGNDVVRGQWGDDTVDGGGGNDVVGGGPGTDVLNGGGGNDRVNARGNDSSVDKVTCGAGKDRAFIDEYDVDAKGGTKFSDCERIQLRTTGTDGNDTFTGFKGKDKLSGGKGDDRLYGLDGADELVGGEGSDVIEGGKGVDTIYGGNLGGSDTLSGGAGKDVIWAVNPTDKFAVKDTITCEGKDTLHVDQLDVIINRDKCGVVKVSTLPVATTVLTNSPLENLGCGYDPATGLPVQPTGTKDGDVVCPSDSGDDDPNQGTPTD